MQLLIEAFNLHYIVSSKGLRSLLIAGKAEGELVLCDLTPPLSRVVELGSFGEALCPRPTPGEGAPAGPANPAEPAARRYAAPALA